MSSILAEMDGWISYVIQTRKKYVIVALRKIAEPVEWVRTTLNPLECSVSCYIHEMRMEHSKPSQFDEGVSFRSVAASSGFIGRSTMVHLHGHAGRMVTIKPQVVVWFSVGLSSESMDLFVWTYWKKICIDHLISENTASRDWEFSAI